MPVPGAAPAVTQQPPPRPHSRALPGGAPTPLRGVGDVGRGGGDPKTENLLFLAQMVA